MLRKFMNRLVQSVRQSSLSSRAFFALTVISGVAFMLTGFEEEVFFLLTGLMGVIWLSCVALHRAQRSGQHKMNPFTLLLFLCAALGIGLFVYSVTGTRYQPEIEPIERLSRSIQSMLDEGDVVPEEIGLQTGAVLQSADHNLIITDENDGVLYSLNNWRVGYPETLYPLTVSHSDLVMLMGENEQVVSVAYRVPEWTDSRFLDARSSLTRTVRQPDPQPDPATDVSDATVPAAGPQPDPAADASDATVPAAGREQLIDLYFPDFGQYINQSIYKLAHEPLLLGEEHGWKNLSLFDWQGEQVVGIDRTEPGNMDSTLRSLVSELNALDEQSRESLKEYAAWYDGAIDSARSPERNGIFVRMLKSENGRYNAYLLYEHENEHIMPIYQAWQRDNQRRDVAGNLALCMIPAIIVFLALWVFVDAKRRGQNHPALWAVLTMIGNVVAWIIYMMVRPQMTVSINGKAAPRGVCPLCGTRLKSDFIACPGCGILLRRRCKACGRALENDWSFCPYCAAAVTGEPAPLTEGGEAPSE